MKKIILAATAAMTLSACDGREAKYGDTVAIHFEGWLDGVQFQGGTGDADLKLGSGQFVPGFEEQLIGVKVGDSRDVALRFPDNYHPGLSGKDVVFKVKVKGIK